jgi:hypothetical protein
LSRSNVVAVLLVLFATFGAACSSGGKSPPPPWDEVPAPPPADRPASGPPREGVDARRVAAPAATGELCADANVVRRAPSRPGPRLSDDAWILASEFDAAPQDAPKAETRAAPEIPQEAPPTRDDKIAEAVTDQEKVVPHFEAMPSRWFITPPPYEINDPDDPWNPYRRNRLKGDFPIIEPDVFLSLTATNRTIAEARRVPVPRGNTGPIGGVGSSFFGDGDQFQFLNYTSLTIDLFKGPQAFKPVDWRFRMTPVFNVENLQTGEVGVVDVSPAEGKHRTTDDGAIQELFFEYHLADLSDRYDFIAAAAGIQAFRSDFRGFIFDDVNLGLRVFGNADDNKWQYNLAFFDMLEKDTRSELNEFRDRDQFVLVANVYRQDWPVLGYTASASFHWNRDDGGVHFDENGFLVRPAPVGLAKPHQVDAYYLGLAGEGHFGRLNVTHAFYQAFGTDDNNPFATKPVDINAQFAALELSVDVDWARFRLFGMYASGDDDPLDSDATGFDAIVDAPNFAGGDFSFWNRQSLRLLGVGLNQRQSPLPDFSTSKFEGQANFVNPGLLLLGGAVDVELTPTWRAQAGASWLRFMHTEPLEVYLETEAIDESIGFEVFVGTQWRPLLTNNLIVTAGGGALVPGDGLEKIYQSDDVLWHVFIDLTLTW